MQAILATLFISFIPIQSVLPTSGNGNIITVNSVNLRYAQADLGAENISTQDLNFNGNNVTVQKNTNKGLVMTTSTGQASSIFLKEQLKANEINPGFSTYFVMNVYRLNPGPADGYVFVIAADSNSLGASGGGLGYTGIANSVGVEFDFYDNGGENLASSDIFTNGQSSASAGVVFDGSFINQWATKSAGQLVRAFHTWIEYDHSQTRLELRVTPSNEENPASNRPIRPVNALISRVINLTQISNYFYAGFTAATGGLAQQMTLKSWYLSNSYIAGGIDPTSPNLVVDSVGPTAPEFTVNRIDDHYEISLSGSEDAETSVSGYQVKIDTQPWTIYTTPITATSVASYRARAFDEAGNFSLESTMLIYEISFSAADQVQHRELRTNLDEPYLIDKVFDLNGYTYQSWYNNPQFSGEPIQTLPAQSGSVTLYGRPAANTYAINYELNFGEINETLTTSFSTGDSIVMPSPTKLGHTFLGWYYEDTFETLINPNQLPLHDFTAYAKWNLNQYTISFISNEGSAVNAIVENYGTAINQPLNPTRPGYEFAGWYLEETMETPFNFTSMPAMDLTLYAKWTLVPYAVTYSLNGGQLSTNLYTFNIQSPTTLLPIPTREGYTFVGWYLNAMLNGSAISEISTGSLGDLQVYAKWQINTYTLTLIHRDINATIETFSLDYQGALTLPTLNQKPGYTFVGWMLENQLVSNAFVMGTSDITLEALWQGNTMILSFITDKTIIAIHTTSGEMIGTLPTLLMPEGFTFLGWSLAPLDPSQLIQETYIVPNSETLRLYPIWIQTSDGNVINPLFEQNAINNSSMDDAIFTFSITIGIGMMLFVTAYVKQKETYGA